MKKKNRQGTRAKRPFFLPLTKQEKVGYLTHNPAGRPRHLPKGHMMTNEVETQQERMTKERHLGETRMAVDKALNQTRVRHAIDNLVKMMSENRNRIGAFAIVVRATEGRLLVEPITEELGSCFSINELEDRKSAKMLVFDLEGLCTDLRATGRGGIEAVMR